MLSVAESSRRAEAVRLIQRLGLDAPTLDESHADVPTPTMAALADEAAHTTVLAAWLIDRNCRPSPSSVGRFCDFVAADSKAVVRRWRKALCLSNDDRNDLQDLLSLASSSASWPDLGIARRKRLLARPLWAQARLLLAAVCSASRRRKSFGPGLVAAIDRDVAGLSDQNLAPKPWVNGDDLIDMGRKPGPAFRRLLDRAYDAQLDGTVRSRAEALDYARKQR